MRSLREAFKFETIRYFWQAFTFKPLRSLWEAFKLPLSRIVFLKTPATPPPPPSPSATPSPTTDPETRSEAANDEEFVEEDYLPHFKDGQFYPVNIGDVYHDKYHVLGKLGVGSSSTVWLARNLSDHSYVALKVYTQHNSVDRDEFRVYETISKVNPLHDGYAFLSTANDIFKLERKNSDGEVIHHECLVMRPMWDSWQGLLDRSSAGRLPLHLLKVGLIQLLLGLAYLHDECKIIHTDISAQNVMIEFEAGDNSSFEAFAQAEAESPSAKKVIDGIGVVYQTRSLDRPKRFGNCVLSDFGCAVNAGQKLDYWVQPDVYRAPEVMIKGDWSYPIDIWNVGCLIWDLHLGGNLFFGYDPHVEEYTTRAHLAELVALLGPPPVDLLERGTRSGEFFTEDGKFYKIP